MLKNIFFLILFLLVCLSSTAEELPEFRIGKEQAKTFFKKGILQLNNYQYGAAKESFLAALNVMEDFYLARKMLSDAYYLSGEWQESLSELEIIEKRKKMNPIWKNRAEILRLGISGYGRKDGLTFYKHISGDAFRGYRFRNPTDAVVDEEGYLYVVGNETTNIVKFDPNGLPVANIKGGIGRTFDGPSNIAVYKDTLYVTDLVSNLVYTISTKGRFLSRFGGGGVGPGLFHGPTGIVISNDEYLYVVDSGNGRVQKFTLDGKFVLEFGKTDKGKLLFPYGITIENEHIYVVDRGNRRIVVYDNEGNYIKEITHSNIYKPRSVRFFDGRMFVADEQNGVLIYNPSKDKWTKITNFRDTNGEFTKILRPFSSTSDYTGSLYIVDYDRHRVNLFSPKNSLTSNLNVFIERVDLINFPRIALYLRVKNRSNQDLTGIRREAFRVSENSNLYPLVGVSNLKEHNNKISVSLVFENSEKIKSINALLDGFLGSFFSSLTVSDKVEVIRAGRDSEKVYDFGNSPLDIYAKIRKSIPEKEGINIGKSLYQAISNLVPELGPRAVVLLVSGDELPDSFQQYSALRNIQFANAHQIPIIFLSLKDKGEMVEIYKDIAARTGGLFLKVPGSQMEKELYNFIKSKKDRRYIVTYKSKMQTDLSGRYVDLEVSVFYRDIIGRASGGYFIPETN